MCFAEAIECADRLAKFEPRRDMIFPPMPVGSDVGVDSAIATLRRLAHEDAAVR